MLQHPDKIDPRGIYIGLGANLQHPRFGGPAHTLLAALDLLERGAEIRVINLSGWFQSSPVPRSRQQWYVNAMAELDSKLPPRSLLERLHSVEAQLGRVRNQPNQARTVDLDLIDYAGRVVNDPGENGLKLPHPRCAIRRFVLYPLRDIAPRWRHPESGEKLDALVAQLSPEQYVRRLTTATH
jgi:2-amino-4-hydroxy-6-hydroxymethyldihydropteridine diphosphokinase